MTDGERAIVAQLKRIARGLGIPEEEEVGFADTVVRFAELPASTQEVQRRLMEGGYVGRIATDTIPVPTDNGYVLPKTQLHKYGFTIPKDYVFPDGYVPTESSNPTWERIMRDGEGEHLLNPDADHTGEDVE